MRKNYLNHMRNIKIILIILFFISKTANSQNDASIGDVDNTSNIASVFIIDSLNQITISYVCKDSIVCTNQLFDSTFLKYKDKKNVYFNIHLGRENHVRVEENTLSKYGELSFLGVGSHYNSIILPNDLKKCVNLDTIQFEYYSKPQLSEIQEVIFEVPNLKCFWILLPRKWDGEREFLKSLERLIEESTSLESVVILGTRKYCRIKKIAKKQNVNLHWE